MKPAGSLREQKASLRKELRQKLLALSSSEKREASRRILGRLFEHPRFQKAAFLLSFVGRPDEVNTLPLLEKALERGKKLYVPAVDPLKKEIRLLMLKSINELKPGPFGILEPPFRAERVGVPEKLDLVLVPGLGFDSQGTRLGRGEGYFDRFLKQASNAYKIGLAFECQRVGKIPSEAQDVPMDEIIFGSMK